MPEIQRTLIEPDILVMTLSGRLALGRECQAVEWTVDELLAGGPRKVVFELSKLEYLDSTGIGILATCCGRIEASGGQVRLAALHPKVADLMRLTKLDRVINSCPTVEEAVASLGAVT